MEDSPLTTDRRPAARWLWLGPTIWITIFLAFVAAAFVVAFEGAMHFAGTAIDGPFQLYNALRRIGAGQRPGVDFQFFHGLGIPYVHYWLYRLFGAGLRGSELARELLATLAYPVVYVAVFYAFTRSWTRAVALAAAALAASFLLHLAAMLFAINGMLGLRSAVPTLLPIVLLIPGRTPRRSVMVGGMLGLGLFMSTEQGLAGLLAFTLVSGLGVATRRDRLRRAMDLGIALAIAVAVFLFALVLVGGVSGLLGALRFNFRVIPMDQYWYFGAPPNVFVSSWRAGFRMLVRTPPIGVPIALCICAAVWYCWSFARARDDVWERRQFALAFLSVYGLVSCTSLLGAFSVVYAQPCWRVVLIAAALEVSRASARYDERHRKRAFLGLSRGEAAGAFGLAGLAFFKIDLLSTTLLFSLPHIVGDHAFGSEHFSASGIWPETLQEGQAVVNAHRGADGKPPVIWSTYAGWLEARNGVFNPSTDYIIHALGPRGRADYVAKLRTTRPDLVQTVRPSYTFYEAWLENTSWSFYDAVLDEYAVEAMTPWSVFWKRRATRSDSLQLLGEMSVPAGTDSVRFPQLFSARDSTPALIEVEIEYRTHNPLGRLPIIGATPRYLIGIQGAMSRLAVSLDPFVQRERFPLVVAPGQAPTLRFVTFSLLPGASWQARTIRLYRRPIDAGSKAWFDDLLTTLPPPR